MHMCPSVNEITKLSVSVLAFQ